MKELTSKELQFSAEEIWSVMAPMTEHTSYAVHIYDLDEVRLRAAVRRQSEFVYLDEAIDKLLAMAGVPGEFRVKKIIPYGESVVVKLETECDARSLPEGSE